jgi:hypothetical protein
MWTDEEVELLLRVTSDYKVAKTMEGVAMDRLFFVIERRRRYFVLESAIFLSRVVLLL